VSAAVALKTLEIYQERRILDHVRAVAPHFQKRVRNLTEHPLIGEAVGRGLLGGVEIVKDKATRKNFEPTQQVGAAVARHAEEAGLIIRPMLNDRIAFCPPLVIDVPEIDELFSRFETALNKTLDWATREKLL
jgi:4-aminobutyrate--pyruvate transaminase